MKHLEKLTRKRLGEILVDEGLISKSQLADAEREQKRAGDPLGAILVESDYVTEWDLAKTVAAQYQLPFAQLGSFPRSKEISELFTPEEQRKERFVVLDRIGPVATLAVAQMPELEFLHSVQEKLGAIPFLFVSLLSEIESAIDGSEGKKPAPPAAPKKPAAAKPKTTEEEELDALAALDRALPDGIDFDAAEEEPDESDESWEDIFDSANASILNEIEKD